MTKTKKLLALISNILLVAFVAYSIFICYFGSAFGNMVGSGPVIFRYYTMDSNILAALLSLPMIFALIGALRGKEIPAWVHTLRYVATVCIMITFLVVVVFLGSLYGLRALFAGTNLFLHGISPILCFVSFLFFEKGELSENAYPFTLLPVAFYGIFYFTFVVLLKIWPDFYGFNQGGRWYISLIVMTVAVCLFSALVWYLRKWIGRVGSNK